MLFLVILSCASKEEKLQAYKDYVAKISSGLMYEEGINNIKVIGERRSIFRSYFADEQLVFINENMSIGRRGESANHYYFKDNELIHFEEKSILFKDDSLSIDRKTIVNSLFFIDGNDTLETNRIIGINNRDLQTFSVDINTTLNLKKLLPADSLIISESGISTKADIELLKSNNVNGILIGEHLMRSADLENQLTQLKEWCRFEN